MNRKKGVEGLRKNIIAPLDYVFANHHLCGSKWCYKTHVKEYTTLSVGEKNERMKAGS